MFAPTASQMLRDDARLRDLHRETIKRGRRFVAKQKKLEKEEKSRRMNVLETRRKQRNKYLYAFRKNQNQNNKPIKVVKVQARKMNKINNYIVPVCHQLPSPIYLSSRETKSENKNEKEEFEMEMSDEISMTELDKFERKHFGIQQSDTYCTRKCLINKKANNNNGYQQIFKNSKQYNECNPSKSLFNMNDIDMKTPEDNDSVKINPKESIDCSKSKK
eukprot:UN11894